ncbi:MAG TPA: S24 family peptidase [Pyrinomonadaceae bacterium]|jgi:hypothetical protein
MWRVPAGFPSPAEDYVEGRIDLNRDLIKHPLATFYLRVAGDSMEPEIQSGALLVVDRAISEATAWRWLNSDTKFREQYRIVRRRVVEHIIVRIQTDAAQAAKVLRDVADDKEASPSARVSAAKTIIELAVKAVEIGDVEARLEALEQHIIKREAQDAFKTALQGRSSATVVRDSITRRSRKGSRKPANWLVFHTARTRRAELPSMTCGILLLLASRKEG